MLAAYEDKSAYAQCIFSLHINDNDGSDEDSIQTFVGKTPGKIVPARDVPNSFGYVSFTFLLICVSLYPFFTLSYTY